MSRLGDALDKRLRALPPGDADAARLCVEHIADLAERGSPMIVGYGHPDAPSGAIDSLEQTDHAIRV